MSRRRWDKWGARFANEANSIGGVFGLLGASAAALGVTLAGPAVAAAGGVVVVAVAAWCGIRAIPPKVLSARDLVGQRFDDLAKLDEIWPRIRRIGFVGATEVGKSTLISHLRSVRAIKERTENPYAVIVRVPGQEEVYFALIDAAGQRYSQQFRVADYSDDLIIFLDHSLSPVDERTNDARLKAHREFVSQLGDHIRDRGLSLGRFHFLLNKRDLWEGGVGAAKLGSWFKSICAEWSKRFGAAESGFHSNLIASDTTAIVDVLRKWSRE